MARHHWRLFALVALAALASSGPASSQNGLVAAYGFNEGSGTTTADASGNANTGTVSGATWNAAGRYGGALAFDGTNDWVTVPDKAVLDLTSAMTVEAWVNASSVGAWRTVLMKESDTGLSYGLYASNADGLPSAWILRTSDIDATAPSALATSTWVHMAATYNGSTLILYVDGSQVATRAVTGAIVTSSQPLRLGGNGPWGEYFAGRIDEVRIYNRALTAAEIQADMNTPVGSITPPAADFSLAATPASRTVTRGGGTTYTVNAGALNGFAGAVTLSVSGLPAGATASFTPAAVTGAGTSTLTVATAASTPVGSSTLTITGTSGALTRTATAGLAVSAAGSGRAIGIKFVGTGTSLGAAETAGVISKSNWNNATGVSRTTPLALADETGAPSGATVTWTASSATQLPITDEAGNRRLMRGYIDATASVVTTVTVAGLPNLAYDVYVYADGNNGGAAKTGAYRISGTGITTTTINLTDAAGTNFNGTFTQATNSSGNFVQFSLAGTGFTLTATPGASATTRRAPVNAVQIVPATLPSPDFAISSAPGSRTVTAGSSTTYTVTTTALNGFAAPVALSVTGLPANATAAFTPALVNGAGTSTMAVTTAANTPGGTTTLTIVGTSAAVTRTATVALTVSATTYSISGVVTPASAGAAATVSLGGTAAANTTANAAGAFSFAGLASGSYLVTPAKSGFTFSPASRSIAVVAANVGGVNFTAAPSTNTISMSAPANGATVSSAFSMSAAASASIIAVQFQVDGVNAGPEDMSPPFAVPVTAPNGPHTLRAIGRNASGNTVTSASIGVTVSGGTGTALSINAAQTFQTMDGFGVNLNSLSWKNGELAPALDRLIDEVGVKTWRVVFDMGDWESTNDNANPNTPNWTYYNALYANAKFQNLWGTLHHLNQRGVTSGIAISVMGRVPPWMGGATITNTTAMEAEWVETVATLFYYAKNTAGVQFDMVDPINESDLDGIEGPIVDESQYTRLLEKLSVKLDAMGLGALRFLGPNTADPFTGSDRFIPRMLANSIVMSKVDHFGLHSYAGSAGNADAVIKGSAYPQKNFWMTELAIPEQIFTLIGQGAAGAQIWDAYDSVYNHAILAGRGSTPPNDAGNLPALMAYNPTSGVYTARPQFYQMQAFKYVMPGSIRIGATESHSSLTVYAFRHPTTGRVTLVGRNTGGASITVTGSMSGVGSVGALQLHQAGISDNYTSFTRGSDAVVTGGAFVATVAANSFFTLTSSGQ